MIAGERMSTLFGAAVLLVGFASCRDEEKNLYGDVTIYVGHRKVYPYTVDFGVTERIHGGAPAPEGMFPFMVFLLAESGRRYFVCSGSLLTKKWILTAGHCVHKELHQVAVAGRANLECYFKARVREPLTIPVNEARFGLQERFIARKLTHPLYSLEVDFHDMGLLKTENPFKLGSKVEVIKIARRKMRGPSLCTALGWGLTERGRVSTLHYAKNAVVMPARDGCREITSGPVICLEAGGPGTCRGDSGSPLVCNQSVWGVCSFGVGKADCSNNSEEYYSELYPEVSWLDESLVDGAAIPAPFLLLLLLLGTASSFLS